MFASYTMDNHIKFLEESCRAIELSGICSLFCSTVKWNKWNKRNKLDTQCFNFLNFPIYLKFYFK